jgi:hypothetical protein
MNKKGRVDPCLFCVTLILLNNLKIIKNGEKDTYGEVETYNAADDTDNRNKRANYAYDSIQENVDKNVYDEGAEILLLLKGKGK